MTVHTDEESLVLTGLNLPMLLLDLGAVTVLGRPHPGERRLVARLDLAVHRGILDLETIVGRLLSVELVASVTIARSESWTGRRYTTSCVVALSRGDWTVELQLS